MVMKLLLLLLLQLLWIQVVVVFVVVGNRRKAPGGNWHVTGRSGIGTHWRLDAVARSVMGGWRKTVLIWMKTGMVEAGPSHKTDRRRVIVTI